MNEDLFNLSHGRLFDTQGEGLHAVWRRAACNRQEDESPGEPDGAGSRVLRWLLPAIGIVAVLGYLLPVFL